MDYYGRSEGVSGEKQLLRDHLRNVAELAGGFAEDAGLPREMGEWAGWLHDLGKYSDEFQPWHSASRAPSPALPRVWLRCALDRIPANSCRLPPGRALSS